MKTILHLIDQWNSSRLELFKISVPDNNLKFFGVMRFFYESTDKFQTKCLRVSNDMKVKDLLPILIEKFYISINRSSENDLQLFERSSSTDRLLEAEDLPLLIQLLWCKDDKEGIFVLKNSMKDSKTSRRPRSQTRKEKVVSSSCLSPYSSRCLDRVCHNPPSKSPKSMSKSPSLNSTPSFLSRTISNPESLMRLKRKSKLEEKLCEISKSGKVNSGGTLKIYGESLNPLIPYKSLLLSIDDTAEFVVREILDKYGLENEDENDFCLVCCTFKDINTQEIEVEQILHKSHSPLKILLQTNQKAGLIKFKVIKCPSHFKRRRKPKQQYPSPDVCKGISDRKSNYKKSESSHIEREVQYYSNEVYDDRSTPLNLSESINNNDSNNKIYSTPPSSETPVRMIRRSESDKRPLPTYEESMTALRTWNMKSSKHSYKDSTDSFSLSSDYQEGSSCNTDSCDSSRLPCSTTTERADEGGVIISDLDSHLSRHLPVQITYFKSKEDLLLDSILLNIKPSQTKFKLASAYVLHLMVVDIIRLTFINKATVVDQELIIGMFIDKVVSKIRQSIMQSRTIISLQAYWLANCTEFLHLLKTNILLNQFNRSHFDKYYDLFADNAQWCFQCISFGFTDDVINTLSVLLNDDADDPEEKDDIPLSRKASDPTKMSDLIRTISSCMTILQQCHVNPALIIQIISRIFHLINCWIFNSFVENPSHVSRYWARTILNRIERVRNWSERHDLLLAADCYFRQSVQVCKLLLMEKTDIEVLYNEIVDMVDINSIQLRYLLENYNYSANEARVPRIWIDFVVSGANQVADKVFEEEGIEITLKERESLNLPLLLPEDGYHVDSLYGGIPVGFIEFLEKLHKEWCFYKISHQDIHFDWLCQQKVHNEYTQDAAECQAAKPSVSEPQPMKSEEQNKTYSLNRHQLKLSDFKANVYNEHHINNNNNSSITQQLDHNSSSAAESGIDTYRQHSTSSHCAVNVGADKAQSKHAKHGSLPQELENVNRQFAFDFNLDFHNNNCTKSVSDTCSTRAPSFSSEMVELDDSRTSHSKRLRVIEEMSQSAEMNADHRPIAQDQLQSVISDQDRTDSKTLRQPICDINRNIDEDSCRINYHQFHDIESRLANIEKLQNLKRADYILQMERIKCFNELESQMDTIDKYSFLNTNTLPCRSSRGGSQPPLSFVPASLALRNTLNYPPRIRPKPRINVYIDKRSNSAANISKSDSSFEISPKFKPRSFSNDRYYSRMSDGMENLSFQEKVQLFEFAINRSSH